MRETPVPKPRFTGIFIPTEILEIEELNPSEIILLAWIDALQAKEYGGCFASNEYLAKHLKLKSDTIQKMITKLKSLNLVKQVSFDGRTRILATYNWFDQSEADPENNPGQTRTKLRVRPGLKCVPTYIYSKEDSKEYITPLIPQRGSEKKSDVLSSSKSDNIYNVVKPSSNSKVKDPPQEKTKFLDHIQAA